MRASLRIDALICEPEPFHGAAVDQVLLHNLRGVFRLYMSVPDRLGIDNDRRAVLALIEAAGLVDADRIPQARRLRDLLKLRVQFALAICSARGPRRPFGTDIMANKNVMFENWQT